MRAVVTRVSPLVLIAFGACSLAGSYAVRTPAAAWWTLAAYALVALLFLPDWRYPLLCLMFSSLAGAAVAYSTWRVGSGGVDRAAVAGLRIVILAWPGSVAAGYLDPARLADYAAMSLHLPARPVAAVSVALQRFASLHDAWAETTRSRRIRGLAPSANPLGWVRHSAALGFAVFARSLRSASSTSIAMDARGFASASSRTWAEPATWTRTDVVALVVAVGLGLVPMVVLAVGARTGG